MRRFKNPYLHHGCTMDLTNLRESPVPLLDFECFEEEEIVQEIVEEIDSDEFSEYTMMSLEENDQLSTILEETSIDLWTISNEDDKSIPMPTLEDLDSIFSMKSMVLIQDTINVQKEISCSEGALDDVMNDSLGHMVDILDV